jgi:hypothetical protein
MGIERQAMARHRRKWKRFYWKPQRTVAFEEEEKKGKKKKKEEEEDKEEKKEEKE